MDRQCLNDLHEHELAYFVDSLTPHQRTFLNRLVGEFLTAFPREGESFPMELLPLVQQASGNLFALLDHLRRYTPDDSDSDIRPFAFTCPAPGRGVLVLSRRILNWPGIWERTSHDWVTELRLGRLEVDMRHVEEITSSVIAWLVILAQHLPEQRLHLLHASPQVRRSIQVLQLGRVLVGA